MKITIQAFKDTFTWESEIDSADLPEVIYQIKGLLVAAGYHPRNVDDCFSPDAFEWFPEEHKVEDYLKSEGFQELQQKAEALLPKS